MSNTKNIVIGVAVIAIIGATAVFLAKPDAQQAPEGQREASSAPVATASVSYSLSEVTAHASAKSCWTAVSGKVYDVTAWVAEHPGGSEAILSLCGKDGTQAFMSQHGGQGRPEAELSRFLIGTLAK